MMKVQVFTLLYLLYATKKISFKKILLKIALHKNADYENTHIFYQCISQKCRYSTNEYAMSN